MGEPIPVSEIPDFVTWSESEIGFYVDQHPDDENELWVKQKRPIRWSARERRMLRWAFTFDEDGRLPLSELVIVDIGKSAKSLKGAALAQWFGMFVDADAEIQIAANSKDHAGIRGYAQLRKSLEWNPYRLEIAEDIESRTVFRDTGNVLRPVPMRGASVSGGNAVFMWFDEIWAYEGNRARNMMSEMKESPTRNVSFTLITSYPPFEGDDGPLNDTLTAFFDPARNDAPREGIEQVEGLEDLPLWFNPKSGVAVWWNHDPYPWHQYRDKYGNTFLDRQRASYMTKGNLNEYLRIWEARRVSREDAFIPEARWDACTDEDLRPLDEFDRHVPMVIGVDLGYKGDSSAAVARRWDPVLQKFVLLKHKIWYPEDYRANEKRLLLDVMTWLEDMNRRHRVLGIYYDPSQAALMAALMEKGGARMQETTQNNMRIVADTNYRNVVLSGAMRNYPAPDLKAAAMSAIILRTKSDSIRIDKRKTSQHIDVVVADSMCCYGCLENKRVFERLARRGNKPPPPPQAQRSPWRDIFRQGVGYGR